MQKGRLILLETACQLWNSSDTLNDNPIDKDGLFVDERITDGRIYDSIGDGAVLHVMIQKIRKRLELLPLREIRLLMYRYGIDHLDNKTIEETDVFFHLAE